jgi:hypothetical protein
MDSHRICLVDLDNGRIAGIYHRHSWTWRIHLRKNQSEIINKKSQMELTGKIIAVLPERGGISKAGNEWKIQEFVLETQEQYPRKMMFNVFGADRLAQFNIQLGEVLTVSFDIDSREYNGRWYNDIRAWKVDRNVAAPAAPVAPAGAPVPPPMADPFSSAAAPQMNASNEADDLPF